MAVTVTPTAWGNTQFKFADAAANGTMPTTLEQLGWILEGTAELRNEAGDVLELKEEGGILRDELRKEGKLILAGTIIGIPEAMRTKFWDMDGNKVKSTVNAKKFATQLCAPDVVGSETIDAPYCSVAMGPLYSSDQGYTAEVEVTILRGPADYLFEFGTIA